MTAAMSALVPGDLFAASGALTAGQHSQSMLEPQQQGEEHGHAIIEAKEGSGPSGPAHEWNVWLEQEGIVVLPDETLPWICRSVVKPHRARRQANGRGYRVVNAFAIPLALSVTVLLVPMGGPMRSGPSAIFVGPRPLEVNGVAMFARTSNLN